MKIIQTKVCVIGAGAGGFGCYYRLLKNNIDAVIVDKNSSFGGTMVFGGVSCWEPGVSLDGVHNLLSRELMKLPNACMVAKSVPNGRLLENSDINSLEKYPWGLSVKSNDNYESTLKRCRLFCKSSDDFRRFQFEEEKMSYVMSETIQKMNGRNMFGYVLCDVEKSGRNIKSVIVRKNNETVKIYADYFVDATGNIILSRMAGCKTATGAEDKSDYNEPSAGIKNEKSINGVTYVFRISKNSCREFDDIKVSVPDENIKNILSCFNLYPNGDINVNMLPTMSGEEYLKLGKNADKKGKEIVLMYWNWLQNEKGMKDYYCKKIYSAGIREDYRLVGKYVLTENDIRKGLSANFNNIVAIADHPMDIHGEKSVCREINEPYIIPVECSIPNEYDNLFVACRGASFSHIAASSARLSRTLLSFGEGVGEYICEIIKNNKFTNTIQKKAFLNFLNKIKY